MIRVGFWEAPAQNVYFVCLVQRPIGFCANIDKEGEVSELGCAVCLLLHSRPLLNDGKIWRHNLIGRQHAGRKNRVSKFNAKGLFNRQ